MITTSNLTTTVDVILFTGMSGNLFQRALGAYQIAGYLRRHGYSVQVIDHTNYFSEGELAELLHKFIGPNTLALGVSSTFFSDLKSTFIATQKTFGAVIPANVEAAVKNAKAHWPKLKIVFGGARSLAGETLDYVDCVIHGYGEDKFLNYLKEVEASTTVPSSREKKTTWTLAAPKTSSKVVVSKDPIDPKFDIQSLDHAFHPRDCITYKEVLPIEISRGCIFKCKFCAYPLNGKKKMDYLRDVSRIKDEIMHNYEKFSTTSYFIGDDTFNDSTFKLEQLHKMIVSLPFKIKFTCYLRADLLYAHQEQIPMLREMGLVSPFFGIESLNQKSATSIGKGMNTEKLKEFLNELYVDHWKSEVPLTCSFIVGLPHETEETIAATFDWVKASKINAVFFPLVLDTKTLYQSEFNRNFMEYGYSVDPETGQWSNENFTQARASALAAQYNDFLMYDRDVPSSWFLMTLLNHGMTLAEAKTVRVKDLNWTKLIKAARSRVFSYRQQLLSL